MDDSSASEKCPLCGERIDTREKVVVAWDKEKKAPVTLHLSCTLATSKMKDGEKKWLFR